MKLNIYRTADIICSCSASPVPMDEPNDIKIYSICNTCICIYRKCYYTTKAMFCFVLFLLLKAMPSPYLLFRYFSCV